MYIIKGQLIGYYSQLSYVECVIDSTDNLWAVACNNAVQAKTIQELINYPIHKISNLKAVWIEGPRGGRYNLKTGKLIK